MCIQAIRRTFGLLPTLAGAVALDAVVEFLYRAFIRPRQTAWHHLFRVGARRAPLGKG